jgi:predicted DNA-binding transcriptional regulator AlpA
MWKNAAMNSEPKQTSSSEARFIDEKQLLAKLPISRRTLFNWRTSGKIPCVRLGGRRILFHWPSVEAALLRYQHPAR